MRSSLFAVLLVALGLIGSADAWCATIEDFFGSYEGTAISGDAEGLTERDISVEIHGSKRGFTVRWTTATPVSDAEVKHKSYTIDFERSNRDHVYGSAMRKDLFGNRVPLNPLKGDAYVWATLYDATLTIYSLLITESGGYEMQQYDRTLTEDGLQLVFSRFREGRELKRVTGELVRVER